MKHNQTSTFPIFTVSGLAAAEVRAKLAKAEKKVGLSHVVFKDDLGNTVGVLVDAEGFNLLMKALAVLENPAQAAELQREADRSPENTMALEEAFG